MAKERKKTVMEKEWASFLGRFVLRNRNRSSSAPREASCTAPAPEEFVLLRSHSFCLLFVFSPGATTAAALRPAAPGLRRALCRCRRREPTAPGMVRPFSPFLPCKIHPNPSSSYLVICIRIWSNLKCMCIHVLCLLISIFLIGRPLLGSPITSVCVIFFIKKSGGACAPTVKCVWIFCGSDKFLWIAVYLGCFFVGKWIKAMGQRVWNLLRKLRGRGTDTFVYGYERQGWNPWLGSHPEF
jgi:hypothetical protein